MSSEHSYLFLSPVLLSFELFLCVFLFVAVFALWLSPGGLSWALSRTRGPAIPGPSGLPLLGMVFVFTGSLTHRALAKLAEAFKAKPLMAFSVGFTRFIISSRPDTAKEILNSSAFADRPVKESAYQLLFHKAMGFAPFGEYWRNLRRISATHLFSPKRIASFGEFRTSIGSKMVDEIKVLMGRNVNGEVEVRKVLHFGSLNNVMMSVFGRNYVFGERCGNYEGCELEGLVSEGYELLGVFNWSDHFPLLGWLDLQGVRKRCRILVAKVNVFVGRIIEEHRAKRVENGIILITGEADEGSGDFVDVLLDLEKENRLSDSDMIAVLWVSFGTLLIYLFIFVYNRCI
jgi:cytochrome P450